MLGFLNGCTIPKVLHIFPFFLLFFHTRILRTIGTKQLYCKRVTFQEFYTLSTCFDITAFRVPAYLSIFAG